MGKHLWGTQPPGLKGPEKLGPAHKKRGHGLDSSGTLRPLCDGGPWGVGVGTEQLSAGVSNRAKIKDGFGALQSGAPQATTPGPIYCGK